MAFQETQIFILFIYRGISQESYLTTMICILVEYAHLQHATFMFVSVWFCVYKISVAFLRAICLESFHVSLLYTRLLFCCCFWDIMCLFSNEISTYEKQFSAFAGHLGQIQWDHPVPWIVMLCTQISLYPLLPLQSNGLDLVVLYYLFNSPSKYGNVLLGTPILVHAT